MAGALGWLNESGRSLLVRRSLRHSLIPVLPQ